MSKHTIVLTSAEPTSAQLSAFKTGAGISVTDTALDAKLTAWLKEGMMKVQSYYGRTLLAGTMEVVVTEREANSPVKIHATIDTISSVTDGAGGTLSYTRWGNVIQPYKYTECVVVNFSTKVNTQDVAPLVEVAERYASIRYEGLSEDEATRAIIGNAYIY